MDFMILFLRDAATTVATVTGTLMLILFAMSVVVGGRKWRG